MKSLVICVAGGIGSGKTEVSKRLATRLGWQRAAFGDYVRSVAEQRGIPVDREHLQPLGEALLGEGIREFCAAVLRYAGWTPGSGLVLDGIRHAEALAMIRELVTPLNATLIYLAATDDVRAARLSSARPSDGDKLAQLDRHSTEVQVKVTLPDLADLVLDGTKQPDDLVAAICDWLSPS